MFETNCYLNVLNILGVIAGESSAEAVEKE
jgi:hypothetical protein